MQADFLLYGSYGYTGQLIAREALKSGLRPLLAGRNAAELGVQAAELGLQHRTFDLADAAALEAALTEVPVVLHAAGPFSRTAEPMARACLRTGTHYLDITGEIAVFETLHRMDAVAGAAGVMLLPGAGFDVVPTDSLAAHLKRRLPTGDRLVLAFQALGGGVSRGTATTAVENLGRGGAVRRGGKIVRVPAAWRTRDIDLGRGPVRVVTIPWGDLSTAHYSTGIPDIEVYMRVPASQRRLMVASRYMGWLLGSAPIQRWMKAMIRSTKPGPSDAERGRGESLIWGEVQDGAGMRSVSRMRTPEGYTLTALTAVGLVREVLAGRAPAGFQTPSLAYGPDWILGIEGVSREDVE